MSLLESCIYHAGCLIIMGGLCLWWNTVRVATDFFAEKFRHTLSLRTTLDIMEFDCKSAPQSASLWTIDNDIPRFAWHHNGLYREWSFNKKGLARKIRQEGRGRIAYVTTAVEKMHVSAQVYAGQLRSILINLSNGGDTVQRWCCLYPV